MEKHPYINAILAIVVIVGIVAFTKMYITEGPSLSDDSLSGLTGITGNVVATTQGLQTCQVCNCIQQMPYTDGSLSFVVGNLPVQECSNSLCSEQGEKKFYHPNWIARVRDGSVACEV